MYSPGPEQSQMQEQMQEPEPIDQAGWHTDPAIIGPVMAAIIVAIVGPLIVWKVKTMGRRKSNG